MSRLSIGKVSFGFGLAVVLLVLVSSSAFAAPADTSVLDFDADVIPSIKTPIVSLFLALMAVGTMAYLKLNEIAE